MRGLLPLANATSSLQGMRSDFPSRALPFLLCRCEVYSRTPGIYLLKQQALIRWHSCTQTAFAITIVNELRCECLIECALFHMLSSSMSHRVEQPTVHNEHIQNRRIDSEWPVFCLSIFPSWGRPACIDYGNQFERKSNFISRPLQVAKLQLYPLRSIRSLAPA